MSISQEIEAAALTAWSEAVETHPHIDIPNGKNLFVMGFAMGAMWAIDFAGKVEIKGE